MRNRISITVEFKPNDLWIGLFWDRQLLAFHMWICLLPTLPIHLCIVSPSTGERS